MASKQKREVGNSSNAEENHIARALVVLLVAITCLIQFGVIGSQSTLAQERAQAQWTTQRTAHASAPSPDTTFFVCVIAASV